MLGGWKARRLESWKARRLGSNIEVGMGTRRRQIGRDYAAARCGNAEETRTE